MERMGNRGPKGIKFVLCHFASLSLVEEDWNIRGPKARPQPHTSAALAAHGGRALRETGSQDVEEMGAFRSMTQPPLPKLVQI